MSEGYYMDRQRQQNSKSLLQNDEDSPSSLHLPQQVRAQRCCPYNCFHPFVMRENNFDIPPALFLNLICHNVNMPDEHAVVVLALIDRFCSKVTELSYEGNRFYVRLPRPVNEPRGQDSQGQP